MVMSSRKLSGKLCEKSLFKNSKSESLKTWTFTGSGNVNAIKIAIYNNLKQSEYSPNSNQSDLKQSKRSEHNLIQFKPNLKMILTVLTQSETI